MTQTTSILERRLPADQAGVAEAVRDAGRQGLAVYPRGGGVMLDQWPSPQRPGLDLSMAALDRVVDYPAADMTITVEAGMTLAELTRLLAAQRQRLPVDIPHGDRATIGGAVAVGAAGPRRYGYGALRDYVLGLSVVDGKGVLFHGGGRVVKNAAGYNMCRLMVGAYGTLGVVTQVTLMVRPCCEASVFLVCEVSDLSVAERLLIDLLAAPVRPAAVEFVAGGGAAHDLPLGPMLKGNIGRLYVAFEGAEAEVDWMAEELRRRWVAAGATAPMLAPTSRAEFLWRWLTDFTGDVQINVLPSATLSTLAKILAHDPDCTIHAHAGDGVIRIRRGANGQSSLSAEREAGDSGSSRFSTLISQWREWATAAGGKMVVHERLPDDRLGITDIWGPPGGEARIMHALKERFDPQNILNPGQFVFP